jgi:hypothetical protein
VSFVAAQKNAVKQLAAANAALSQATGTGNAGGWSVRVIDPPSQASTTPLRKSKMAEVILGGVLGGLLVSFLAVVALTPAKKEVRCFRTRRLLTRRLPWGIPGYHSVTGAGPGPHPRLTKNDDPMGDAAPLRVHRAGSDESAHTASGRARRSRSDGRRNRGCLGRVLEQHTDKQIHPGH